MTTKHTPGPWNFDNHSPALPVLGIYAADGKNPFHGDRSQEELAANARLIAAAPELLEALQGLLNALPSATTHPAIKVARAAIAKAIGEQK